MIATLMWATPGGAGEPLTWQNCLDLATLHNPSLAAARAKTEAAEAGIDIARSALRPQVSAGASANQGSRASAGSGGLSNSSDVSGNAGGGDGASYSASATVEQSLYSGGKNKAEVRTAQATLALTGANTMNTKAQLTHDLRAAYINLLYAQEQVQLLQTIARRRQDNLELVDLRYEGGREHKGSRALSEASLFDAQVQLKQAERLVSVNSRLLSRTIGLTDTVSNLVVTGTLDTAEPPILTDLNRLVQNTPSYRASVATIRVAEAQVDSARGAQRPDLSLTGSAGRTGGEAANDDNEWSVGLKLTVPIWDGGKTIHTIRKAKAALTEAEANLADTLNTLTRNLAESYQALANAEESVAVQSKYVEAADLRAGIARQQYEDGLLTFENWSLIEDDLISKRKQFVDARKNAMTAEAAWWLATGRELIASTSDEVKGEK